MKTPNISKSAEKALDKMDFQTKTRILGGIMGLFVEPPQGDIKSLKGQLAGLYRLRVGSWRIVYEITENAINIIDVTPRGGAYK